MTTRTTTTAEVIESEHTLLEWRDVAVATAKIADELAAEVTRLHNEIDRLKGGDSQGPLESKADWTHPLYARWVELGLDDLGKLREAWTLIWVANECPACRADLTKGPYAPFLQCELCQLCFVATPNHFALDTLERAIDRGSDER